MELYRFQNISKCLEFIDEKEVSVYVTYSTYKSYVLHVFYILQVYVNLIIKHVLVGFVLMLETDETDFYLELPDTSFLTSRTTPPQKKKEKNYNKKKKKINIT